MKEADLKGLHMVWLYVYVCVYNILKNYKNYEKSKKINGCQGLERGNDE